MRAVLLACVLAIVACESATPAPSPSAQATAPAQPVPSRIPVTTRAVPFGNGLVLDVPIAWQTAAPGSVNRGTYRLLFAGNGDIASLKTIPGNGDVDLAAMPDDRVAIEVESFCRLSCGGPASETAVPPDWSQAAPLYGSSPPSGKHELAIGFRWFDDPLFVVARWSDGAPAADVAAIERVVRSIRPEVIPPASGEYRGWDGVGPLANVAIGSVTLRPVPMGVSFPPATQTYDMVPYYLVRGRVNVYAFSSQPLLDKRCSLQYDVGSDRFWCQIDARRVEWTRFGRFLGPEPASDLVQYRVIVRDGSVWVWYGHGTVSSPPVPDENAER